MPGTAIRIDISTELAAIKAGQCGGCRIGTTHPHSAACDHPGEYAPMAHHEDCGTMYHANLFERCPVCWPPENK